MMDSNKAMICKNFESEIWLFLDKSLPDNEMDFWYNHISQCETCKNLLEQTEDILSAAEHDIHDIDDSKFNYMIERATAKSGFSLNDFFRNFSIRPFKFSLVYRVALTGALVLAVIFISPAFREKNADKIISNDLLDWNGAQINMELNQVSEKLFSANQNRWNKEIEYIDSRIANLTQQSNAESF